MSHTEVTLGPPTLPTIWGILGHNLHRTQPTLLGFDSGEFLSVDVVPNLPDDVIHCFFLSVVVECNIVETPAVHKGAGAPLQIRYNWTRVGLHLDNNAQVQEDRVGHHPSPEGDKG